MENIMKTTIHLFSINDFHGIIESIRWWEGRLDDLYKHSGIAMFSKLMELKEENEKNAILVAAGDMFGSPSLEEEGPGKITIPLMNLAGFSIMTIGNHEFDWIPGNPNFFKEVQEKINFPLLSCNLFYKKTGKRPSFVKTSRIVKVAGFKLALIGVTTEECHTLCLEEELGAYEVRESMVYIKQEIERVKEEGAEIIFLVAHMGVIQDPNNGKLLGEVADILKGFSINEVQGVLTAHSHQRLAGKINGIPIVQGGAYGNGIGHIQIEVDLKNKSVSSIKGNVINIENTTSHNHIHPRVKKIVDFYRGIDSNRVEKIGYTPIDLEVKPYKETYWGKFVTNAMGEEMEAEVSFINTGAFRSVIRAGVIYDIDIKENLPFNNTIYTMDLKGRDIKKLIERSINLLRGRLQIEGIRYDMVDEGKKIQNVKLKNGSTLDLEKRYKVATSNYLADGGDFFTEFQRGCNRRDSNTIIREAVIKAVIKKEFL